MKNFYLHSWATNNVKKILKKINVCIEKNQYCRLWIMCAEEYDYLPIENYNLSKFCFESAFVETILVLGVLKHYNTEIYTRYGIKVVIWPTFWFYKAIASVNTENLKTRRDFKNLFICLNNRGHPHRVKTIEQIVTNNLLNDGVISWHDKTVRPSQLDSNLSLKSEKDTQFDQHILPNEFNECLINLVTESTVDNYLIDVSEKTINAIISGMPFLIIGCPKVHKKLEKLGFKLFTEIFDYEFDSFINLDERIEAVINQLSSIKEKYHKRYAQIYRAIEPKILHNRLQLVKIINQNQDLPKEVLNFPAYAEILNEAKIKKELIRRRQ